MHRPFRRTVTPLAMALALSSPYASAETAEPVLAEQQLLTFDLPAGPLEATLTAIARQSGRGIAFSASLTRDLSAPPLQGRYSSEEAIRQVLHGSPLQLGVTPNGTLTVEPREQQGTIDLERISVTVGSRTPSSVSETAGTVWVVEQAQLREQLQTGVSLKEALGKLVPSLDLGPEGRTNYGQNLRGRGVLVMIDGVSQNSSRGLSRQFDSIDPFNVERVEVLSGASSLYGGGATGGIINIVTRKGESGPLGFQTQASMSSGFNASDDLSSRLAQSVSGGNDSIRGRLGVSVEKNEAFYDGAGEQIFLDNTQTDLQYNRRIDVLGSLGLTLDEQQSLDLLAQYYDSGYDGSTGIYFPNLNHNAPSDLEDAELRGGYSSDLEPRTRRTLFNASYHHGDLLGQDFYLQGYHRQENDNFYPFTYYNRGTPTGSNGVYFAASQQNFEMSGLKALFAKQWDAWKLTYGLDLDRERFNATQKTFDARVSSESGGLDLVTASEAPRYPSYRVKGLSGYLQLDWKATERLTLSSGARRQHMDVEVEDYRGVPGGDNDYEVDLYNLSALYDLGGGQQLWTNYSEGFELADPAKYYGRAGLDVAANPLAGIKSRQVETGWRYADSAWEAQAALYYIWSDKVIEIDTATLNIDVASKKSRDYGFETALTRHFDSGWQAGGNLHLVRSQERDDDGDWKKRDAKSSSLSKATAFAGWSDDLSQARLQVNHARSLEDDDGNRIQGFTTLDLMGSRELGMGTLSLGIQNLLDRQYSTVWGQRATMFYSPTYGPAYLYDYQGRGRTYTLTWAMTY